MPDSPASPPRGSSKRPRHGQPSPSLPDDVIVKKILTRVPAAAAVRFRTVCRAWHAALTSDHFVQAHHRAFRADTQPEIVFFAPRPASGGFSTAFYRCKLELTTQQNGSSLDEAAASASARELVTVDNLRPSDLVLSGTRPCHGLTLLLQIKPNASAYHVCNLSTGEHVSLPPCTPARTWIPYIGAPCYVLSSTGLCFDPVAGEHKVVRLYEDWEKQQRCEAYGLRSGGWRPFAGQVPPHAAKGLDAGRPPVFLNGCFYWHIDMESKKSINAQQEAISFSTPDQSILSLTVDTEQFGWVHPPEERKHRVFHLTELDGSLCVVVDLRLTVEEYELWTWPSGSSSPPSWSLRCRISLASLPGPMRDDLGRGIRMLPLASSFGGKILLATSCHEVHAYDPERNSSDRVFSVDDFVNAPGEAVPLLNIALYKESVTGVWHRPAAGDVSQLLKMKIGSKSNMVARREGLGQRPKGFAVTPQLVQLMLRPALEQYHSIVNNMYN